VEVEVEVLSRLNSSLSRLSIAQGLGDVLFMARGQLGGCGDEYEWTNSSSSENTSDARY
jgi:hypothetical protein